MSNVCEHCGKGNRTTAMFCIGCAGKLPGFSPSGPSALETMKAWSPRTGSSGSTIEGKLGADRAPSSSSAVKSIWWPLGAIVVTMLVGFMGWFLHVTDKPPAAVRSQFVATPEHEGLQAAAAEVVVRRLPLPPVPQFRALDSSPASEEKSGPDPRVQAVEKFYRALSAADGKTAASFVIPAKRGTGPFSAASISRFYGSFERPLVVRSIRPTDTGLVEAKYSYRVARTTCEGTAIIETERVSQETLIRRIRANC